MNGKENNYVENFQGKTTAYCDGFLEGMHYATYVLGQHPYPLSNDEGPAVNDEATDYMEGYVAGYREGLDSFYKAFRRYPIEATADRGDSV